MLKKVVQILNCLGHSVSYEVIQGIDTEMTHSSVEASRNIPFELDRSGKSFIGVAFDNYDSKVETMLGKDSLHETTGIVYQTVSSTSGMLDTSHN